MIYQYVVQRGSLVLYQIGGVQNKSLDSEAAVAENEIDELNKLIADGLRFHESGDVSSARDCYLKVLEHDPRNSKALDLAGLLCMQCGEPDAAKEFYNSAIEVEPDNPRFLLHLGILLLEQDKLVESEAVRATSFRIRRRLC